MPVSNQVNTKHKDRLIRFLFQKKKDLLSLYNAINHSHYENENDLDIYSSTIQTIPIPRYYVLYNGVKEIPDEVILRLTDSMPGENAAEISCAEFTAHVLNINEGHNQDLLNACPLLGEYARFIAIVRNYSNSGLPIKEAIDKATTYCIDHNILTDVLLANRAEVTDMVLTEYDETFHIESEKKISYDRGQFLKGMDDLKNLMASTQWDLETAMDKLKVPETDREKYRAEINKLPE